MGRGFLGDQFYFLFGARLLRRYPGLAPPIARAHSLLERYDAPLVIGMRFMYGLRTAGPLV
jgi:membrane protein DedA with SNARE-associated domain